MSDAFSPGQCSLGYLKTQIIHLRSSSEPQNAQTVAVLTLYEEELRRQGWQVLISEEGIPSFQQVTSLVMAS
ncbi:hypothetical protein KDA_75780 [Dictyobacter alpinus]|uniref:Uncharacterized protein n=1 Tax=Dictyobacter alpinus TaxID=2014873 RepID=A0A402BL72_9CHLR|nr:hypothetical protein [Dictyobacter alpinus]GCE32094.1 hypothetical protein KDA_75780 [Dictyobacter alpinus]